MPTYNKNAQPPAGNKSSAPEGDYVLRVVEFKSGLSQGPKTRGCPAYFPVLAFEKDGEINAKFWNLEPQLTDDSSRGAESNQTWQIFQFVKAAGYDLDKNPDFEFFTESNQPDAETISAHPGRLWINPVGLRLHAHVETREYTKRDGGKGIGNQVKTWYVDRPKLARVEGTSDAIVEPPF